MSTLNVSNITDGTTTVGTSYVVNGSAKAWAFVDQNPTQVLKDSLNVSSITDNGTGETTISFTNAMANTNYGALGGNQAGASCGVVAANVATSSYKWLAVSRSDSYTPFDADISVSAAFGDLA